jgi:hypothetical protein
MFQMIKPPHDEEVEAQPGQPRDITRVQETIRSVHGCASRYRRTVHVVHGTGNNAWDGFVMTLDLIDFPKAKYCYAWKDRAKPDAGFAIVLGSPLVNSPESAVKEWTEARLQ